MFKINHFRLLLYFNRGKNGFNLFTSLIFILSFINIYYKINWTANGFESAFNLWNPSWLLFGPLLFCSYKTFAGKPIVIGLRHLLHLLPFFLFACFYTVTYISTDMSDPWHNELFVIYQNSYAVIIVSLFFYSCYTIMIVIKSNIPNKARKESLLITLSAIYILICLVMTIMYMAWGIVKIEDLGVDYRFFSYGLLFFSNIAILWYWILAKGAKPASLPIIATEDHKSYKNSALNEQTAEEYKQHINTYFQKSAIYLDSNLSLEVLAKELHIPKHYLSQLFNIYFEKSFHNFVAEYRINYAIELLNSNNGRLKIESLAYSCGFNSKTSFNRYFKERTGLTPSEYQFQLNAQSA